MIFLATIVTGGAVPRLLGTVWGVMTAFSAVAVQESASIKALAPGVSAALLTTIAGLVVAIPSVFGYNFLLASTKRLVTELENFASSLADRIELEKPTRLPVAHRGAAEPAGDVEDARHDAVVPALIPLVPAIIFPHGPDFKRERQMHPSRS